MQIKLKINRFYQEIQFLPTAFNRYVAQGKDESGMSWTLYCKQSVIPYIQSVQVGDVITFSLLGFSRKQGFNAGEALWETVEKSLDKQGEV